MAKFIATLRAVYEAEDEVAGQLIAEQIRESAGELLDEEDTVTLTQVVDDPEMLRPDEAIVLFKRARNHLIKTRLRPCFELARELDKTIYMLEQRIEHSPDLTGYDYGKFMDLAESILIKKEYPHE